MKYLIPDYLEATAAKYPDKVAFVDPDSSATLRSWFFVRALLAPH